MFFQARQITKRFGPEPILAGVSLDLAAGETLGVLGRSGCGKTTLLKILAGLVPADAGEILLSGHRIDALPPQRRNVVYLYQEPLLFPHLDVFENVAFGLRLRRVPASALRESVERMLESLELAAHRAKMPTQLSGGQRQRVAFGRALIVNPALLLLDEPFASLDFEIRASMQRLFKRVAAQFAITTIFVTHDLKEALLMGDRLAHLRAGRLRAYDSREAFIRDPETGVGGEVDFWASLDAAAAPALLP